MVHIVYEYVPTLAIAGAATIALAANGSLWTTALNPIHNETNRKKRRSIKYQYSYSKKITLILP